MLLYISCHHTIFAINVTIHTLSPYNICHQCYYTYLVTIQYLPSMLLYIPCHHTIFAINVIIVCVPYLVNIQYLHQRYHSLHAMPCYHTMVAINVTIPCTDCWVKLRGSHLLHGRGVLVVHPCGRLGRELLVVHPCGRLPSVHLRSILPLWSWRVPAGSGVCLCLCTVDTLS